MFACLSSGAAWRENRFFCVLVVFGCLVVDWLFGFWLFYVVDGSTHWLWRAVASLEKLVET